MYDVIIIGAGAAGMSAAVHCAKHKLKTLVVSKSAPVLKSKDFSLLPPEVLQIRFKDELKNHPQWLAWKKTQEVVALEKNVVSFSAETKQGEIHYAKSIILACGQEGSGSFDLLTAKDVNDKIKVDALTRTNVPGIFAAGAATAESFGDMFVSMGEGAKAAVSAKNWLKK